MEEKFVKFDGNRLVKSVAELLMRLEGLAAAISDGLSHHEGHGDCIPSMELDKDALEGFGRIFKSAHEVKLALALAAMGAIPVKPGEAIPPENQDISGIDLATVETWGKS